jgi:hypothetical protein
MDVPVFLVAIALTHQAKLATANVRRNRYKFPNFVVYKNFNYMEVQTSSFSIVFVSKNKL